MIGLAEIRAIAMALPPVEEGPPVRVCAPNRGIRGCRKELRRSGRGRQEHDGQPAREGSKSYCGRGSKVI